MPWGPLLSLHETRDDLLETLLPFFKVGLEAGESVRGRLEPLTEEEVWQHWTGRFPASTGTSPTRASGLEGPGRLSGGRRDQSPSDHWQLERAARAALAGGYQGSG